MAITLFSLFGACKELFIESIEFRFSPCVKPMLLTSFLYG